MTSSIGLRLFTDQLLSCFLLPCTKTSRIPMAPYTTAPAAIRMRRTVRRGRLQERRQRERPAARSTGTPIIVR